MASGIEVSGTIRCLVLFLNFLVAMAGIGIVGLGTWSAVTVGEFRSLLSADNGIFTAVYIMIAVGALLLFVSVFGCLSVMLSNKHLIAVYLVVFFFVLVLQVVGSVLPFVFFPIATDEAQTSITRYNNDSNVQRGWDKIQGVLKCCGIQDYTDWKPRPEYPNLPSSCCSDKPSSCTDSSDTRFFEGCGDLLKLFFYVIGSVGAGIIAIVLLSMCAGAYALRQVMD